MDEGVGSAQTRGHQTQGRKPSKQTDGWRPTEHTRCVARSPSNAVPTLSYLLEPRAWVWAQKECHDATAERLVERVCTEASTHAHKKSQGEHALDPYDGYGRKTKCKTERERKGKENAKTRQRQDKTVDTSPAQAHKIQTR